MIYLRFGVKLQNMSETLKSTDTAVIEITHLGIEPGNVSHECAFLCVLEFESLIHNINL